MRDFVSIIIPVFNRSELIKETLDSIIAQTHLNWECLIIDDGSTDATMDTLNAYAAIEPRFRLFVRGKDRVKGANACRNIGLENACGDYIVFFDSDDLMTFDHLDVKVQNLINTNFDFVVAKTQVLDNENADTPNYKFTEYKLTPHNYVAQKINWLTLDVCIKTEIAKSIRFNELLQSGQEYNYFSKLVYISTNVFFVNQNISLRRRHETSIRGELYKNKVSGRSYLVSSWLTYLDIKNVAEKNTRILLLKRCLDIIHHENQVPLNSHIPFIKAVLTEFKLRGLYVIPMIFSMKMFKRTYYFRKNIK